VPGPVEFATGTPANPPIMPAVVMGGTSLSGGVGGPHRTLLGVLVIGILSNGMDLIGYQEIVKGCVIVAAVALSIDRKKYSFIK
jgi:ribose transport system permease protein/putative xylitol transport system permease protein